MPSVQNISIMQGEYRRVPVIVTDKDGNRVPLTGYDLRYQANTTSPIVKDIDDGTVVLDSDPLSGECYFDLLPGDSSSLAISGTKRYEHEFRVKAPTGEVYVPFVGYLEISEELIEEMDPTS